MPQSQKGRETMNRFDTMGKDALPRRRDYEFHKAE